MIYEDRRVILLVEDFIIAVDAEQTIRGNMRVYWEQDGAFIESVEEVGE